VNWQILICEHMIFYVILTREHLGVSSEDEYCDVTDPVNMDFYKNVWLKQASINTTIYDKVHLSIHMSI